MTVLADPGKARILIVEDEGFTSGLLCAALKGAGFDVHSASSAAEARRAVADFDPDANPKETPVPATLDWDLWLGVAAARPYDPAYLPRSWRGYFDFGTGVLGDMGCHMMDGGFYAFDLPAPTSVEAVAASQTLYGILGITLVLLVGGIMLLFVKAPPKTVAAQ